MQKMRISIAYQLHNFDQCNLIDNDNDKRMKDWHPLEFHMLNYVNMDDLNNQIALVRFEEIIKSFMIAIFNNR
jgi:hypothetical protein